MTAYEVVRLICGGRTRIEELEESFPGPGCCNCRVQEDGSLGVIRLTAPTGTDGYSLGVAAHEAFHVRRWLDGEPFYQVPPFLLPAVALRNEELIVNRLARGWLAGYLTHKQQPDAERCFYESESGYVDDFYWDASCALHSLRYYPEQDAQNARVQIVASVLGLAVRSVPAEIEEL